MDNNELNRKIIEKVRNTVVISNLESEENMRISKKKQVLSLVAVLMIMFVGSFATVNAATNGELVDKVKESIKVVFTKQDGKKVDVKEKTYIDSNNHTIEQYEVQENGMEYSLKVDKNNLDGEELTINGELKEDGINLEINKK